MTRSLVGIVRGVAGRGTNITLLGEARSRRSTTKGLIVGPYLSPPSMGLTPSDRAGCRWSTTEWREAACICRLETNNPTPPDMVLQTTGLKLETSARRLDPSYPLSVPR